MVSNESGSMRPPRHTQPYLLAEAFSPKDACPVSAFSMNLDHVHASACWFAMLYTACTLLSSGPEKIAHEWPASVPDSVANVSINRLTMMYCIIKPQSCVKIP